MLVHPNLLALKPSIPGDPTGTAASRIADMMELFGFNIFPDASPANAPNNIMGSAPANYTVASITAAYNFITGSSGLILKTRAWNYIGWYSQDSPVCPALAIATGTQITMETGGVVGAQTTGTTITLGSESHNSTGNSAGAPQWMRWSDGNNEPNGIGGETSAETLACNQALQAGLAAYPEILIMSPSIVIGLPFPEGYISGYLGANQAAMAATCSIWNVHYYPSQNPSLDDGSSRGGEIQDVYIGTNIGYGSTKPEFITEYHPTLYMTGNPNLGSAGWSPAFDSYLLPIGLLETFRQGFIGLIWYALYDFDSAFSTGFWANDARSDAARAPANTMQAMFQLTGDTNPTKHTFAPGKLNYSLTGLPVVVNAQSPNSGGQSMLFQNSNGTYFLYVWNSQNAPGGTPVSVTLTFNNHTMRNVKDYVVSNSTSSTAPKTAVQNINNVKTMTISLNAAVHLLVITY